MMMRLAGLLLLCCAPVVRAQVVPVLSGVVTDVGTPGLFEVNGRPVACKTGETITNRPVGHELHGSVTCSEHFLGEAVSVYGSEHGQLAPIRASSVLLEAPADVSVEGVAIVDAVITKSKREVVVRADGYLLHLTPDTKMTFEATLTAGLQSFQTNQWVQYRGVLHPDGTVMVREASLGPNVISDAEDKLRSKAEFDPAAVSEKDRQSAAGRYFTGVDRTRLPAYSDPPLQARVEAIGTKLIPAYQTALPDGDPSKIHFQFQLVDEKKYAYFPLASGIVLVSHQAASLLTNDDQMAALLATAIADVLQKQELRAQPTRHAIMGSEVAGAVAGAFIPGAGLTTYVAGQGVNSRLEERMLQQRARESLWLMNDAGYDVRQAPLAFWTLAEKPGASLSQTKPTEHVLYLYGLLGTAWKAKLAASPAAGA